MADNLTDLIAKIDGRVIRLDFKSITLQTKSAQINEVKLNFRHRILQSVSDPNVAYILLLLGILGIIFEFSAPGIRFPAIVGLICILLAFYGLSTLPVNIVGVVLIFVAAGFFVLEAHSHSFGLLGLGGVLSLVFGSLFLTKSFSYRSSDRTYTANYISIPFSYLFCKPYSFFINFLNQFFIFPKL